MKLTYLLVLLLLFDSSLQLLRNGFMRLLGFGGSNYQAVIIRNP